MNRLKTIFFLALNLSCFQAMADDKLDAELWARCLASFDIIEKQDLQAFNDLMPYKPSGEEIEHNKAYLEKKYAYWFIKSGGITEITKEKIQYEAPSKVMKERHGAILQAKTRLHILGKKMNAYTSCTFIQTADGWFLSRLP